MEGVLKKIKKRESLLICFKLTNEFDNFHECYQEFNNYCNSETEKIFLQYLQKKKRNRKK